MGVYLSTDEQAFVLRVSSMGKLIVIVLAGRTFPAISSAEGDYEDWISAGLNSSLPQQVLAAWDSPEFPPLAEVAGVVVSGSHVMVTDQLPWSERLGGWLKSCVEAEIPVLGICYGHQLLAHACGGKVGNRIEGIEIGTHQIELTAQALGDPLFGDMPPHFPANLVHFQSVLELPEAAQLLAFSAAEPHQAFRIGNCAWGVQFHPEFSAAAMDGYIQQVRLSHSADALDQASAKVTPEAGSLLRRFGELSKSRA